MTTSPAIPRPPRHYLLDLKAEPLQDWGHWLKLWDEAEYGFQRMALLRAIFSVKTHTNQQYANQIALLLDVADGFRSTYNLEQYDAEGYYLHGPNSDTLRNERHQIAICAAEVLHQTLLDKPDYKVKEWLSWLLLIKGMPEKLIWFTRVPVFDRSSNIHGPHRQSSVITNEDLEKRLNRLGSQLWRLFWTLPETFLDHKGNRRRPNSEELVIFEHITSLRPQLLPLMERLGELNSLLSPRYHPDLATCKAVRAMALETRNGKKPKSLKLALHEGRVAAHVAYCLEPIMTEDKRLAKLEAAKLRAEAAATSQPVIKPVRSSRRAA